MVHPMHQMETSHDPQRNGVDQFMAEALRETRLKCDEMIFVFS